MIRRVSLVCSLLVLAFSAGHSAPVQDKAVSMKPLQGEWKDKGGVWTTEGERPPAGWYLRSSQQYDIGTFSFALKKKAPGELVFIYLKDWQIVLRPDSITARFNGFYGPGKPPYRFWDYYWFTATRPMEFSTTDWERFDVSVEGGGIAISRNGSEVLRFNSPESEWGEKVRASGKFPAFPDYRFPDALPGCSGAEQVLIIQGYDSGLAVKDLSVNGTDAGEAEGFASGKGTSAIIPGDDQLPLILPEGTVKVDWMLDPAAAEDVQKLPAVEQWELGKDSFVEMPDKLQDQVGKDTTPNGKSFPEIMTYRVGAVEPGQLMRQLVLKRRFPALMQEGRVEFNLAKPGTYTLELGWGGNGLGWGPNVVEVSVDGKPVLREVYRSYGQNAGCYPGLEAIPLALPAGPHRVDVRLVTDRYGYNLFMKHLYFALDEFRLVPGVQVPWKVADTANPRDVTQKAPAIDDDPALGEWSARELDYRMTGLKPNAPITLELVFFEYESSHPGGRVMRIDINGRTVEPALDLFTEAGWGARVVRTYSAKANARGEIELQLSGLKGKAFLNALAVRDGGGRTIFRENFGWSPLVAARMKKLKNENLDAPLAMRPAPAEPPRWTPEQPFDGHNLAANPRFSLQDQQRSGKPRFWYSVREMSDLSAKEYNAKDLEAFDPSLARQLLSFQGGKMPEFLSFYKLYQGDGAFFWDSAVGRDNPGSMRIEGTGKDFGVMCNMPLIDPHKRQKFSFYARGGGSPVRAVILWFAMNMDSDARWRDRGGAPLLLPRLQFIGASRGAEVRPGKEWAEVSVEAQPPAEAFYAALVVEASEHEKGSPVWIDDAEFNGYGSEPLEITRSYAGYHPYGEKSVVVKSFSEAPVQWRMTDSKGAVVANGSLDRNDYEWFSKRHYFHLDFAGIKQPGDYILEVSQAGNTAQAPIQISADTYRNLTALTLRGLHMKRFNAAIKDAHDPDLLDYASVPKTRSAPRFSVFEPLVFPERIDISGGYYDAGDEIQHAEFWPVVILATENARERAGKDRQLAESAAAEFDWITAAFHKFALEDGTFITSAKPQGYGLDNVPGYATDPLPEQERNMKQAPGACAMAAFELREKNPALSRRYLEIAEAGYNNPGLWKTVAEAKEVGPTEVSAAAKTLWAETYLSKLSDKADYRKRMGKSAQVLAQGLKNRSYANLTEMVHAADQNGAAIQDCAWVSTRFIRMYPDHPAVPALKEGLRAFANHVEELSANTVWGQAAAMNGVQPGQAPGRFPSYGDTYTRNVGYWPMLAYALAETGIVLEDEKIIRLAERQLQWCLGRNMADLSVVQGVGDRVVNGGDRLFWRDQFFAHWLQSPDRAMIIPGNVPTLAFRDVGSATPDSVAKIVGGDMGAPFILYPQGYAIMGVQPPYGFMPGAPSAPSEFYLPQIAQMILAASSVDAGLRWIEEKSGFPNAGTGSRKQTDARDHSLP